MKTVARKLAWVVFAAAVLAAGSASAARADDLLTAKVPFPFIVGNVRLPAGDYVVSEASNGPSVLQVTTADGRRTVYVLTTAAARLPGDATQPELTFDKFGSEYFLAGINPQNGDAREIVLTPSLMERELVKSAENHN